MKITPTAAWLLSTNILLAASALLSTSAFAQGINELDGKLIRSPEGAVALIVRDASHPSGGLRRWLGNTRYYEACLPTYGTARLVAQAAYAQFGNGAALNPAVDCPVIVQPLAETSPPPSLSAAAIWTNEANQIAVIDRERQSAYQPGVFSVFSEPRPGLSCPDEFSEFMSSAWDLVVDQVTYFGEHAWADVEGLGKLATGDPSGLIDSINHRFTTPMGMSPLAAKYLTPLGQTSVLLDLAPDGAFTDALDYAYETVDEMNTAARQSMNPLNAAYMVAGDINEVGGDMLAVVRNLGDPEAFVNEMVAFNQKWNPTVTLSLILTEGDPALGLTKAGARWQRQVELAATYASLGKYRTATMAVRATVQKELKQAIREVALARLSNDLCPLITDSNLCDSPIDWGANTLGLPAPVRAETAVLMGAFIAQELSTIEEQNPISNPGHHPLYAGPTQIREIDNEFIGRDSGSGGYFNWAMIHPKVEENPGCISLGDVIYNEEPPYGHFSLPADTTFHADNRPDTKLKVLCSVESGYGDWWTRPIDYERVWGDNCSGGHYDRSVWAPVCPSGYDALGFVASGRDNFKPYPNRIACLKSDLSLLKMVDGPTADLQFATNDSGSGSSGDLTAFNRVVLGMNVAYAINFYPPDLAAYTASVRVPTLWGLPKDVRWYQLVDFPLTDDERTQIRDAYQAEGMEGVRGQSQAQLQTTLGNAELATSLYASLHPESALAEQLRSGAHYKGRIVRDLSQGAPRYARISGNAKRLIRNEDLANCTRWFGPAQAVEGEVYDLFETASPVNAATECRSLALFDRKSIRNVNGPTSEGSTYAVVFGGKKRKMPDRRTAISCAVDYPSPTGGQDVNARFFNSIPDGSLINLRIDCPKGYARQQQIRRR